MPSTYFPTLLAAGPTTSTTAAEMSPAAPSAGAVVVAVLAAAASIAIAWLIGILRPSKWSTLERVPASRPLGPLAGVLFAGLVVWLVAPTLVLRPGPVAPGQPVTTEPSPRMPTMRQLVIVNATIPLVAFAVLLVGDALVRPRVGQQLGFDLASLPRGVATGAIGIAFTLPIVYGSMVVAEAVYRWVDYRHPSEHDLLRAMGETPDPVVKYLAIAAAVAVAPLWEELLFRGHIQTLLRAMMTRIRAIGEAVDPAQAVSARAGVMTEAVLPAVLTAALFAGVHQPWTWPPIFVLSVCLGLAYERTGNLWTPIVMHAAFNGLMTTYFLLRG